MKKLPSTAGFEHARAKPNRFQVCLLNHSDISTWLIVEACRYLKFIKHFGQRNHYDIVLKSDYDILKKWELYDYEEVDHLVFLLFFSMGMTISSLPLNCCVHVIDFWKVICNAMKVILYLIIVFVVGASAAFCLPKMVFVAKKLLPT